MPVKKKAMKVKAKKAPARKVVKKKVTKKKAVAKKKAVVKKRIVKKPAAKKAATKSSSWTPTPVKVKKAVKKKAVPKTGVSREAVAAKFSPGSQTAAHARAKVQAKLVADEAKETTAPATIPSFEGKLPDAMAMQKLIANAAQGQPVDRDTAEAAVNVVLTQGANQLRAYLMAVAKTKMSEVNDMMEWLSMLQSELTKPERVQDMDGSELIRLVTVMQTSVAGSLTLMERVANVSHRQDPDAFRFPGDMLGQGDVLASLPELNRLQRETVRQVSVEVMRVIETTKQQAN